MTGLVAFMAFVAFLVWRHAVWVAARGEAGPPCPRCNGRGVYYGWPDGKMGEITCGCPAGREERRCRRG